MRPEAGTAPQAAPAPSPAPQKPAEAELSFQHLIRNMVVARQRGSRG
jgi:hypothetical protein